MQKIVCPECGCDYCYNDSFINVCPQCANEFEDVQIQTVKKYFDSNNVELFDGDNVTVIKDLKVNGSSSVIKQGTKVKNIKLQDDEHDIRCKIDAMGSIELKTKYVKKIRP